jgi:hypothetical protein
MKPKQKRGGAAPPLYLSFSGMAKVISVLALFYTSIPLVKAQKQDYVWCFGDSAGLDFNSGSPVPFQSAMNAHEAASSIADKQGNLLFYVGDRNFSTQYSSVRNFNHQIMYNGDSLLSAGSVTNGLMIVPFPDDSNKYYLFHRSYPPGLLYYSVIGISLQGGLGAVDQKNILLIGNTNLAERIGAIKHANGRDWWVFIHPYGNNEFQLMLVTPQGIAGPFSQFIGSVYSTLSSFIGEIATSINGDKIAIASSSGFIDVFDFDRCLGVISNWINIGPLNPTIPFNSYYGCEFSENSQLLYVSIGEPPYSQLLQYNLLSPAPWVPYYIYTNSHDSISFGQLQRGPDRKIYMANAYIPNWPNSTFDSLNMYIGVINDPDSIGLACNFTPYSVYLGGRRSFYSLPNMPNYNLGALAGSPCDTLTGINQATVSNHVFEIFPSPVTEYFTIKKSATENSENVFNIKIFDSSGKLVYEDNEYIVDTKINCSEFHSGLYAVSITRNRHQWFSKFIKL